MKVTYVWETGVLVGFDNYLSGKQEFLLVEGIICLGNRHPDWLKKTYVWETGGLFGKQVSGYGFGNRCWEIGVWIWFWETGVWKQVLGTRCLDSFGKQASVLVRKSGVLKSINYVIE